MKFNIDELIQNLCNHIGEFGTKLSEYSFGGALNTKNRNISIFNIGGCSSSKKQKGCVYDIIIVNKIVPITKLNVTHVSEIPINFYDFLFVINFRKTLFGKKKFERNMFPLINRAKVISFQCSN